MQLQALAADLQRPLVVLHAKKIKSFSNPPKPNGTIFRVATSKALMKESLLSYLPVATIDLNNSVVNSVGIKRRSTRRSMSKYSGASSERSAYNCSEEPQPNF